MAGSGNINVLTVDLGAYIGATIHPVVYFPPGYGNVRFLGAKVTGIGAGTSIGLILASATNVGTPAVSGTLAAFAGTVVYAEGVTFGATFTDETLDPGTAGVWLAVDQASGTAPATTILSLSYLMGV